MSEERPTIKILDKGFVSLVDVMGDDAAIAQAARVSYGAGTKSVREDRGLIRYLLSHGHTSPLEMVEFKFHVKVPMDCWRQWIRHRTANVNEYSTRYSVAIEDKQETPQDSWRTQAKNNKQGSVGFIEDHLECQFLTRREVQLHHLVNEVYNERLERGVAREQARKDLPLSNYTEAYWKNDLNNIFKFLALRMDSHAQYEIRMYANAIFELIKPIVPAACEAFQDYVLHGKRFNRMEMELLKKAQEYIDPEYFRNYQRYIETSYKEHGLSKRELVEFKQKMGLKE